jgi:hypothetical protein
MYFNKFIYNILYMNFEVKTGGFPPIIKCQKYEIKSQQEVKKRELGGLNIGINIHNIMKSRRNIK